MIQERGNKTARKRSIDIWATYSFNFLSSQDLYMVLRMTTLWFGGPANTRFITGSSCSLGGPWPSVESQLRSSSKPKTISQKKNNHLQRMAALCSKILKEVCNIIHLPGPAKAPYTSQSTQTLQVASDLLGHMAEHVLQQTGPVSEHSLLLDHILTHFCNHPNIHMIYNHFYFFSTNLQLK